MAEIIFSVNRRVLDQAEAAAKDCARTEPGEANTRPGEYGVGERGGSNAN